MTSRAAATRYARALFDVALKEANVEKTQEDLQQFADLVAGHEMLAHTLANPAVPAAKKRTVVQALLDRAGGITPVVAKLILLLADRDRLVLLPEVALAYRERLMDHQKVLRGDLTTAVPIAVQTVRALEEGLGHATGRRVVLEPRVDPSIIGGVITRLGSTVYDGSVTTQLQKMKEALTQSAQ
jgi:F-type H+-transporting ATPase subunit delta